MVRVLQKWDAETHDDILMAMIKYFSPKIDDWRAIVAILREQGHTFSESALQYVFLAALSSLSLPSLPPPSPPIYLATPTPPLSGFSLPLPTHFSQTKHSSPATASRLLFSPHNTQSNHGNQAHRLGPRRASCASAGRHG